MSTSPSVPPPDDPVARATDALRRTPVPDGPPPETIARTLAALRAAAEEPVVIPQPRRHIMFMILKMAAAALVAVTGLFYFAGLPPAPATAEFVAAATKLQEAQTLSFQQTMTMEGTPMPMKGRVLYKVPGLVRMEHELAEAGVSVMDLIHGKGLVLLPTTKSAMLLEEPPGQKVDPARPRDPAAAMIEDMRRLAQKDNEPVGEKLVGDVRARGFRVKEQGQDMTVWVDPQKKLPVLIEFKGRSGNVDFSGSFADIQLDPPLDDALFRLEPPAGYSLLKANVKLKMSFEEAVARHLRTFTEISGGRFPTRLDDFAELQKLGDTARKKAEAKEAKPKDLKSLFDPKVFEAAAAGAHVAAYCEKMKDQYGYKADGVKFGDAKTIIFWYKPEGQDKYKVVYGDLHIGEATAAEIPK
jgi:outer membrane lipoprotein-sorting protein